MINICCNCANQHINVVRLFVVDLWSYAAVMTGLPGRDMQNGQLASGDAITPTFTHGCDELTGWSRKLI